MGEGRRERALVYFYVTLFSLRHSVCVDMCAWRGEEVVERGGGCGEGRRLWRGYLCISVLPSLLCEFQQVLFTSINSVVLAIITFVF